MRARRGAGLVDRVALPPGVMGTPAAAIFARAAVLEPMAHRARGRADEGDAGALARLGQLAVLGEEAVPGWMASTPALFATSMILSMRR
jgi:hypothetical protein